MFTKLYEFIKRSAPRSGVRLLPRANRTELARPVRSSAAEAVPSRIPASEVRGAGA